MIYNYENNPWKIAFNSFDVDTFGKSESIFVLGNGYLGSRATHEENYIGQTRNTFINGTFNKSTESEVTELPNIPDVIQTQIYVNDVEVNLMRIDFRDYVKSFDYRYGYLVRSFIAIIDSLEVRFRFERFASIANYHIMASRITLSCSESIKVKIISKIDGTMTNSGAMHFKDGVGTILEKECMNYTSETTESNVALEIISSVKTNLAASRIQKANDRRMLKLIHEFHLQEEELVYDRMNYFAHSRDPLYTNREIDLSKEKSKSYDTLLDEHKEEWEHFWLAQEVKVDSEDPMDEIALHFTQYQLRAMTPYHDERLGIGAKALSGEGYKGHSFWDTEIFIFPYYLYTNPEISRKLMKYRYLGLEKAKEKARLNGFEGAQYPWEMAWITDGEVTPVWGAIDIHTGKATKIWSGFIEQHITSDIIYALNQYLQLTNDTEFLKDYGLRMIIETALFWSTRADYNDMLKRYELKNVIGADEYKEHVNNNAFTNYMAKYNIDLSLSYMHQYQDEDWCIKLMDELEMEVKLPLLKDVSQKLYIPTMNEDGYLPQDDTYLSLKDIDLTKYKNQSQVGSLFLDYSLDEVNKMQISKQADVVMLLHLFKELFTDDEIERNFNYYESRTLHDSSLSLSTHAILASSIGNIQLATNLFDLAIRIDVGENMKSSDHGIHAASIGGIWQILVFGFSGIRFANNTLVAKPHLPKRMKKIQIPITVLGNKLLITVMSDNIEVLNFTDNKRKKYIYKQGETIEIL